MVACARQDSAEGFTLVELLVVLLLMSLATGAMAFAFRGSGPEPRAAALKLAAELRQLHDDAVARRAVTALAPKDIAKLGAPRLRVSFRPGGPTLFGAGADRLLFFPDGSSSGGTFRLGAVQVDVNWLDGAVSVRG
jgi:prepilin-type N-terminal cleavage/methylation domain-containing protein